MALSLNALNARLTPTLNNSDSKSFITKFINIKNDGFDDHRSILTQKDVSTLAVSNKKKINIEDFFVNNESSIAMGNNRTGTDNSNIMNKFLTTDRSEKNDQNNFQTFKAKSPRKDKSIIKKIKNSSTVSNSRTPSSKNIHKHTISTTSSNMPRKLNLKDIKEEIKRDYSNNSTYFPQRPLIQHFTNYKINHNSNQQFHSMYTSNQKSDPLEDLRRDFFNQLLVSKNRYDRNSQKVEDLVSETGEEKNSKIFSVDNLIPAQSFQMAIHPSKEDLKLNFLKQKLPKLLEDLNKYGMEELIKNNHEFVRNKYRKFLEQNID